jgi:peptide chain release factor 1
MHLFLFYDTHTPLWFMEEKVSNLLSQLSDLEHELSDPNIVKDRKRYRDVSQKHSLVIDVKNMWEELSSLKKQKKDNEELLHNEDDADFLQVLEEDNASLESKIELIDSKLRTLLIPPHPDDNRNTIIELRAGIGGDEAALFVGDCIRMYFLFADAMGWKYEGLSGTPSDRGGYKEFVMVMSGKNIHRYMQFESGTHRVQRVPETESQGRIHTSAITIAILLEPGEEEAIVIDEKELRIDTFRSSGAGGQHVNTTDSAVRITHLPSGVVVECQEERSQHKNKDKALRFLKVKLVEEQRRKKAEAEAEVRSSQIGSGDRSERIRTYNFPQNRITDHRIGYTRYNLDRCMNGDLEDIMQSLISHYYGTT